MVSVEFDTNDDKNNDKNKKFVNEFSEQEEVTTACIIFYFRLNKSNMNAKTYEINFIYYKSIINSTLSRRIIDTFFNRLR